MEFNYKYLLLYGNGPSGKRRYKLKKKTGCNVSNKIVVGSNVYNFEFGTKCEFKNNNIDRCNIIILVSKRKVIQRVIFAKKLKKSLFF